MSPSNSSRRSLIFSAGAAAYQEIQERGFSAQRIGTLAGASGGAKWLVLSQMDRIVAKHILPQLQAPVHTIGTSIGAWRFACLAQRDPAAAIDRFEEAYLSQSYSEKPDRAEITARTAERREHFRGDDGVDEIRANALRLIADQAPNGLAAHHVDERGRRYVGDGDQVVRRKRRSLDLRSLRMRRPNTPQVAIIPSRKQTIISIN